MRLPGDDSSSSQLSFSKHLMGPSAPPPRLALTYSISLPTTTTNTSTSEKLHLRHIQSAEKTSLYPVPVTSVNRSSWTNARSSGR